MTTPERLRRRQRIEGVLLVVIGLLMLLQSVLFNAQDQRQRECLEDNFTALSNALEVRSELVSRETEAAKRVNLAELTASTDQEVVEELELYKTEIEEIQRIREENPVPPYPSGECN